MNTGHYRSLAIVALALVAVPAAATNYRYAAVAAPVAGAATVVTGINNLGVAAGYYVDLSAGLPGTYYSFTANADGSGFASFTRPGYEQTGAAGINDAGEIVGVSVLTFGTGSGFIRSPTGSFTDIVPTFGGVPSAYSEAIGINNSGTIVGFYTDVVPPSLDDIGAYSHGFILEGGVYSKLDVPAALGFGTQLYSVNAAGFVTGGFMDNVVGAPHGFIWSAGTGFLFPTGAAPGGIGAINDYGSFTYSLYAPQPLSPLGYVSSAFVQRLGDLPDAIAVPGAFSTETLGMNNLGQVTGLFIDQTGIHGFIATPVPEPATWAMMLAGFGLIGLGQRRRAVAGAARPA